MKMKKIPYYLAPWFLMAGASLTIGLLSFGGVMAIWPLLPLALAAFVLSVAYEGEIYLQNIKGALNKLFKTNHLQRQLAKAFLLHHFPDVPNQDRPQFFTDYERQLKLLHRFEGGRLDKASRDRKRHVKKTLSDMEKWFAVQLFSDEQPSTAYQKQLHTWLRLQEQSSLYRDKYTSRQLTYQAIKAFCIMAGLFMILGTSYLLVDAFTVIPWFAALPVAIWPALIVPLSVIAGVAYGLLVFNAMTDMIESNIFAQWYENLRKSQGVYFVIKLVGLTVMLALTLALSIATAGTWWTVAKTTQPLFNWMTRMPAFVMSVLNPLILSISTWVFNVENVSETLENLDQWLEPSAHENLVEELNTPDALPEENPWQRANPFRILIQMTFDPLRHLLFLGHLVSIGATADRMPGVSSRATFALGFVNEGVEDYHYFFKNKSHQHRHDTPSLLNERLSLKGHSHDNTDLPTLFLTVLYLPLYSLAASWDFYFTGGKIGFWDAFYQHMGQEPEKTVKLTGTDPCCSVDENKTDVTHQSVAPDLFNPNKRRQPATLNTAPQLNWQLEHAIYRIDRFKEKHLKHVWFGQDTAKEKINQLTSIQEKIITAPSKGADYELSIIIKGELGQYDLSPGASLACDKQRFFFYPSNKTNTRLFLEELPARVARPS